MSAYTTHRIIVLTLVFALVIGGAVTGDASARVEATASSVAKHKKKRKAVKCRKNQVPIKLKRRTVGCRSLRAALPPPREGDARPAARQDCARRRPGGAARSPRPASAVA